MRMRRYPAHRVRHVVRPTDLRLPLLPEACARSTPLSVDEVPDACAGRLTEGPNCQLGIAGGSLFFASAGWVTNLNSTLCVQRSIEYAFHRLQANGVMSEILSKWLPPAACGTPVEVAGDAGQSGRRLRDGEPGAPERPVASKRRQQRRRLEPSSGANLGASSGSLVLTVEDFFGLFVVWCAATFLLLAAQGCRLIWGVYKKRLLAARGVTESLEKARMNT